MGRLDLKQREAAWARREQKFLVVVFKDGNAMPRIYLCFLNYLYCPFFPGVFPLEPYFKGPNHKQ